MEKAAAISCDEKSLNSALQEIHASLLPKIKNLKLHSKDLIFNQELTAIWEISNMSTLAQAVLKASLCRHESRGSFFRKDYPNHDTSTIPQHSFVDLEGNTTNKQINIVDFQPSSDGNFAAKNSLI